MFLCLLFKPDYCASMLIYLIILLSSAQGRVLLHMPDILQVQFKNMYLNLSIKLHFNKFFDLKKDVNLFSFSLFLF